ncbi:hypothetical protein QZM67_25590 [Burkholderia sp. AU45251]|nr:hypothetical protein [Burkholderia sp. AU45251]
MGTDVQGTIGQRLSGMSAMTDAVPSAHGGGTLVAIAMNGFNRGDGARNRFGPP